MNPVIMIPHSLYNPSNQSKKKIVVIRIKSEPRHLGFHHPFRETGWISPYELSNLLLSSASTQVVKALAIKEEMFLLLAVLAVLHTPRLRTPI